MKAITHITFCTCENQHLLSPGHTCDICMGTIPSADPIAYGFNSAHSADSIFGPDYFEELEMMQMELSGPDLAA